MNAWTSPHGQFSPDSSDSPRWSSLVAGRISHLKHASLLRLIPASCARDFPCPQPVPATRCLSPKLWMPLPPVTARDVSKPHVRQRIKELRARIRKHLWAPPGQPEPLLVPPAARCHGNGTGPPTPPEATATCTSPAVRLPRPAPGGAAKTTCARAEKLNPRSSHCSPETPSSSVAAPTPERGARARGRPGSQGCGRGSCSHAS